MILFESTVKLSIIIFIISSSLTYAQVPTINIPPGTCFLLPNGPIPLDSLTSKQSPMTIFRSHFSTAPQIPPNELIFQPPVNPFGPTIIGGTDNRNNNNNNNNKENTIPTTQVKEITQEKESTKGGTTNTRTRIVTESRPPPPPPPQPTPVEIIRQTTPPSPFTVKTIYRRPSSRFDVHARKFNSGLLNSDFTPFTPKEPLINRQELEAIAQFEAALEEAKREGLYGLRTRTSRKLNPPPKSPSRSRNVLDNQERPVIPPPPVTRVTYDAIDFHNIKDTGKSFDQIVNSARSFDQLFSSRSSNVEKPKFYKWLEESSFLSNMQLAPEVNFTVLIPSDDAIETLPVSFTDEIATNNTKRRELLFYHIIPGSISIDELQSEEMVPTLLKKKGIRVARGEASNSVSMSGGKIIRERGDLTLSNGKVRFIEIDRVLFPPRGSLFTLISEIPDLSIFRNLLIDTGLKEQLESQDSTLTIFAPNDSAFAAVNPEAAALLTRDKSVARSFLLNHFSPSILFVASLPVGSSETIKNIGSQADLQVERPALNHIKVNGITVTFADLQGTNGVLHVIEHVLL